MEVFFDMQVHFNKRKGAYTRTVYKVDGRYYVLEFTKGEIAFFLRSGNKKYSATHILPMELLRELSKSQI